LWHYFQPFLAVQFLLEICYNFPALNFLVILVFGVNPTRRPRFVAAPSYVKDHAGRR
jgi:hypothetical protein